MELKELLRRLSETPGVAGHEERVRELIRKELESYAHEVKVDKLGNIIALKKGKGDKEVKKIMLAAHMDEIGLVITKIEEGGFLRFSTIGGVDNRILLGREVVVHGLRDLPGLIGAKPPSLVLPEESEKVLPREEMFIDLGLSEGIVRKEVQVGDVATLEGRFCELKNNLISGKALDDRAGVAALVETFRLLKGMEQNWDIYGVTTVQEEVGVRGAITSTFGVGPDLGIVIEVTYGDMVGLPEAETFSLGRGPVIALGPNIHPKLYQGLVDCAKAEEIPYQVEPCPGTTGTDARAMQIVKEGIPTALVSIPLRYMHTTVETISLQDLQRVARLLARFLCRLNSINLEGWS